MIGITGEIGAGKSLVGSILRAKGFCVLDADVLVHELYRENAKLRSEIAKKFGACAINNTGVNSKFIANVIFNNDEKRKELEALVYPLLISTLLKKNPTFVEAAMLENVPELLQHIDEIWVIVADENIRLNRLINNRHFLLADAKQRIKVQRDRNLKSYWQNIFKNKKLRFIDNSKSEVELKKEINAIVVTSCGKLRELRN